MVTSQFFTLLTPSLLATVFRKGVEVVTYWAYHIESDYSQTYI